MTDMKKVYDDLIIINLYDLKGVKHYTKLHQFSKLVLIVLNELFLRCVQINDYLGTNF